MGEIRILLVLEYEYSADTLWPAKLASSITVGIEFARVLSAAEHHVLAENPL